jgi:CBS domain-containing protein
MTARPTVINPTISILDATTLMSRSHFRHLPVSGDIGLVGMLDITDVCRALIDPRTARSRTARGRATTQDAALPPLRLEHPYGKITCASRRTPG